VTVLLINDFNVENAIGDHSSWGSRCWQRC